MEADGVKDRKKKKFREFQKLADLVSFDKVAAKIHNPVNELVLSFLLHNILGVYQSSKKEIPLL